MQATKSDFHLEYDHTGYTIRGSNLAVIRARLNEMVTPATAPAVRTPAAPRRTMSAEARERIASAQRKRWAKQHKVAKKVTAPKTMTAAG